MEFVTTAIALVATACDTLISAASFAASSVLVITSTSLDLSERIYNCQASISYLLS
jgi:hypothetical protein